MKFQKHIIWPASLLLASLSACTSLPPAPSLTSVEPELVRIRNAETVTLNLQNWQPGGQVALLPGGPFLQARTELATPATRLINAGGLQWAASGEHVYGMGAQDNQLLAISQFTTHKQVLAMDAVDDFIYVSDNHPALTVVDVSDISRPAHKGELILKQPLQHLAVGLQHACGVDSDQRLYHIQLQDGLPTGINSSVVLPQAATSLAAVEAHCLVVSEDGVRQFSMQLDSTLRRTARYRSNGVTKQVNGRFFPAVLADGNTGLTLIGPLAEHQLQWLGSYNKLGNIVLAAQDGTKVLVADDQGILSLFDISRPETPLLLADYPLLQRPEHLSFSQGKALVASGKQLMQIDFSAAGTPPISNLGVNLGGSRRSFIKGDILYVADWFSGLHLYDISAPHNPQLISSFHTPGSPKGILVKDGTAFVADDDHGLQIVDVSQPLQPRLISHLPLEGLAYTMKLRDNLLYLAAHYGGFHIIDVSDLQQPRLVGSVNTPAKSWAVALLDNLAYVADDNTGVLIFDISNPANPTLAGQYDPGGFAEDIVIREGKAFVAFFDQGLHILDLKNPRKPRLISQLVTPGNARGIQLRGDRLYLASWDAGVHVVDISSLQQPRIIGQYDTAGAAWGLSVKNDKLYAMDWWGGVRVIDLRDETQLRELSQYQAAGTSKDIALQENFAYVAKGGRGLQVFDITNPLNPVWATGLDLLGDARAVVVNSQQVVIASGDGGLQFANISNPFQVRQPFRLPLSHSADLLSLTDDGLLAVAEQNGPLSLVNINQSEPRLITSLPLKVRQLENDGHNILWLDASGIPHTLGVNKLTDTPVANIAKGDFRMLRVFDDWLFLQDSQHLLHAFKRRGEKWQPHSTLPLGRALVDAHWQAGVLYATSEQRELLLVHAEDNAPMKLQSLYPSTNKLGAIAMNSKAIFLGGESIMASVKLLPKVTSSQQKDRIQLHIPGTLPIGSYHVLLQGKDGQQQVLHNAFRVGFPKAKKSKFTLEDLQKVLKQKEFDGKAPVK